MDIVQPGTISPWRSLMGVKATMAPEIRAQRIRIFIGAALTAVIVLGMAVDGARYFSDPDMLWHITVGGDIWHSKSFPHVDAYSHTFAGVPWIAKEWLSQIILFAAYSMGGWNGVLFLCLVVISILVAQIYSVLSGLIQPTYAAAITAFSIALSSDVFLARPYILVLPVLLWFVLGLWDAAQKGKAPPFLLLPVMCVWANMHASFTFGFMVAALSFMSFLYQRRQLRSSDTYKWLLFLALCPVASIIHPYGVEAIWSTVSVAQSELTPYISEWTAFSAQQFIFAEFALLAILGVFAVTRLHLDLVTAAFLCLLTHMYLQYARFVYLFFTIAPVLIAYAASKQFPVISFEKWAEKAGDSAIERAFARYAPVLTGAVVILWAAGLVIASSIANFAPTKTYPAAAIQAARDYGATGNVINYYNFGGALIFERTPTFVDGRAERLFQGGFADKIAKTRAIGGEKTLSDLIEEYDIEWSLYPPGDGRVTVLDNMPGWKRIYEDELAVVHVRKASAE